MSVTNPILKGKRIFIIEDNPKNFAIAKTLLEMEGAAVHFDRFGDDTFSRLKAFAPVDGILLDLMFPNNISGYDLFDQIRQLPEFATVPIIAMSASDPATAIPHTQAQGFAGFISKPISYNHFAEQIAHVIIDNEPIWIQH